MSKKKRIRELETNLRIYKSEIVNLRHKGVGYHARYNKFVNGYTDTLKELESISIKWKIKKIIRRIKRSWLR